MDALYGEIRRLAAFPGSRMIVDFGGVSGEKKELPGERNETSARIGGRQGSTSLGSANIPARANNFLLNKDGNLAEQISSILGRHGWAFDEVKTTAELARTFGREGAGFSTEVDYYIATATRAASSKI